MADPRMFERLIPELATWNDGRGIDVESWLSCVGSFEHAIAYAELFWPAFVEHDDCVLFAGFGQDAYADFMAQTGGDRRAVEAVMNHRHVVDLFARAEVTRDQVEHLGRVLAEVWSAKLRLDFPGRAVIARLSHGPDPDDLLAYELTVVQQPLATTAGS